MEWILIVCIGAFSSGCAQEYQVVMPTREECLEVANTIKTGKGNYAIACIPHNSIIKEKN